MEVISSPVEKIDIEALAEQVFHESINILGGLKNLMEYRNLTWLPSLAVAAYVVIMKEEMMKTHKEIAYELGLTPQTVQNILRAKSEEVQKLIRGEVEKVDEHKAGGIAKLAYERVKKEKIIIIRERELEVLGVEWVIKVLTRLRGADFPLDKNQLGEKLRGITIKEKTADEIIEQMKFPVKNPADVLHQIKKIVG